MARLRNEMRNMRIQQTFISLYHSEEDSVAFCELPLLEVGTVLNYISVPVLDEIKARQVASSAENSCEMS